jgi:hypothetical protein
MVASSSRDADAIGSICTMYRAIVETQDLNVDHSRPQRGVRRIE